MLDLARHYDDVVRLAQACPAFEQAVGAGLDSADLLSSVFASLLERQRGEHPYDPSRSKVSTYVWWVTRSVASNEVRKHRRRLQFEGPAVDADERPLVESDRSADIAEGEDQGRDIRDELRRVADELALDAVDRDMLRRLASGESHKAIREALGMPPARRDRRTDRLHVLVDRLQAYHAGEPDPHQVEPEPAVVVPFTRHLFEDDGQGLLFPARVLNRLCQRAAARRVRWARARRAGGAKGA